MKRIVPILLAALALSVPFEAKAQSVAREQALARHMLTEIQERSFKRNREHCGWIARTAEGKLIASKVFRGTASQCRSRLRLPSGAKLVATFHTHGKYLPRYDNEVPSFIDMINEKSHGTRGYIATPGGRFWVIDGKRNVARLICGPGCLPVDPGYKAKPRDRIRNSYSAKQIMERNGRKPAPAIELCNGMLCTE